MLVRIQPPAQKESMNLVYWTRDCRIKNLGDYLVHIMFTLCDVKLTNDPPAYFCVGSSLDKEHWVAEQPKVIWGAGAKSRITVPQLLAHDTVLTVRGPLTAEWMGLDVPLGDPALLLPFIHQPEKKDVGVVGAVNFYNQDLIEYIEGDTKVSMKVLFYKWRPTVSAIANAEFVLCDSLHASILAHAYGRPWAPHKFEDRYVPHIGRWLDWFAYLGLEEDACQFSSTVNDGRQWWEKQRHKIRRPSLREMVEKCPFEFLKDKLYCLVV